MKKSILLEYLFSAAQIIGEEFGKFNITSNHFMIALLEAINRVRNGDTIPEISTDDARSEFASVQKLLDDFDIPYESIVDFISADIKSEEYNSSMDEFVFRKIKYTADSEARIEKADEVNAVSFLRLILKDPTESIKNRIILRETANATETAGDLSSSDPDNPPAFDFSSLFSSFEEDFFGEAAKPEKPVDTATSVTPEPYSATKELCETVESTKKIQNYLLERIFGQDDAINAFVSGYFQSQVNRAMNKNSRKPGAIFLFAGPPGVGKTFLAETVADALGLPFRRFDMSEYSDKEANFEFAGSDSVYKGGKPGNVTSFVDEHPRSVVLFDEIEKAHLNVIHLFLQILDAGRIRDNHSDREVSFADTVIIFTTNVGRSLYEDSSIANLATIPRKKIIKAISEDKNPTTGEALFPAAICSRLASGHVIMFNHLGAGNLYTIVNNELTKNAEGFCEAMGIGIDIDPKVATAIIFSEGGHADARTVKGKSATFFHEELYEFFRLFDSEKHSGKVEDLKKIRIDVELDGNDAEVSGLFINPKKQEVLIFASGDIKSECERRLEGINCYYADNIADAKDILFNHDISAILCDISCGSRGNEAGVLNVEDVQSAGRDFIAYVIERYTIPVYVMELNDKDISREENLSFMRLGAKGVITVNDGASSLYDKVSDVCDIAYQQNNMFKLAKSNKVLTYKTAQTVSDDKTSAAIKLFNLKLKTATDTEDSGSVLDNISKPDIHFDDVIGAEDAKGELKYFVDYLKNPVEFMRRGVRSPKGVLLYGPPGTGKTMLAKAMAGESDVTFLTAEGNQFLKSRIGAGSDEVHKLFTAARKYAPSIIFIDEIDAVGKDRNSSMGETTGDVLTAFLTEMDGFKNDTSKPVFVLAATNYEVEQGKGKTLDPALLRRFDRRIYVDLPNKDERRRYLEMKISRHGNAELSNAQIDNIAMRSTGMSLAELESVFEMALRNAIRTGGCITDESFEEAFETFSSGEKKEWAPETLLRTARHEAGHALLCWLYGEKPSYLTIVARGDHGGYMQHGDSEDKAIYLKSELAAKIRTALAGRAAELVYYGDEDGISTGASADLYSATKTCERMICNYGMDDDFGLSYIDVSSMDIDTASDMRARVNEVLAAELSLARETVAKNAEAMDKIVAALMEKNHLKGGEIDEIFSKYAIK